MAAEEEEGADYRPPTPFHDENGVSQGWSEERIEGWTFRGQTRGIASAEEAAGLRDELGLGRVPLPEMVYPFNYIECECDESGFALVLDARAALRGWADAQAAGADPTDFDWTFQTDYAGSLSRDKTKLRMLLARTRQIEAPGFGQAVETHARIPFEMLTQRERILFYHSTVLFEDELGDRGLSQLSCKIRVMTRCFLVLLRWYLRVDGDRVELHDTLFFHEFGTPAMLRQRQVRAASVREVRNLMARSRPFSASVSEQAQRDDRFALDAEQVYELVEPERTRREIIMTSVV